MKKQPKTWAQSAEDILQQNLVNLAGKVGAGKPLTAAEMAALEKAAAPPPKPDDAGAYAKSQSELARLVGCNRGTIGKYSHMPDAPKARDDGRLPVVEWRQFLAAHDALRDANSPEIAPLKARQILLQNQLLAQKFDERAGRLIQLADAQKAIGEMIGQAKKVLLAGPASLAPQVVGIPIPEAEKLLREWLHDAMAQLHNNPTGHDPKPAS